MNFWLAFAGYEAVWFAAVIGAGRGLAWPGVAATLSFAAWRLGVSSHRIVELRLIGVALAIGIVIDGLGVGLGLLGYASPWPWAEAPAWLTALWVAFALTIVPLFGYLYRRLWLAALFGAIGGPLAYLSAAHGWHAVVLSPPTWRALLLLAVAWAITLPLLCALARRGLRANVDTKLAPQRGAP